MKSDGDGHKETYLDDRYFYVSLNIYLFVNKGKIFDAQGSWYCRLSKTPGILTCQLVLQVLKHLEF
jgi:hypothetical protein